MSDNDKTPKPDRAGADDFDVPTYSPGKAEGDRTSDNLYNRTGRAAPQNIPPKQSADRSGGATAASAAGGSGSAETTAFSVPGKNPDAEKPAGQDPQPLRSDAPTTAFDRSDRSAPSSGYADTDFAPVDNSVFTEPTPQPTPQPTNPTQFEDRPTDTGTGATTAGAATAGAGAGAGAVGLAQADDRAGREGAVAEPREHRRGTIDFGLLVIRLLLGVYLVLVSVATFFQLGGSPGLSDLQNEYSAYTVPDILAIVVPSLQLFAGVFLIFGLITPLFAALATIVTSFTALHALTDSGAGLNVFAWEADVMLSVVLLVISLALQFTGPGLYSFDFGRRWARRPLVSSWIFVVLGIAGAVALWWFGAGVNPLN